MKRNLGIAAVVLALSAGVASASEVNPGLQQIANQLGVDAGAYSASELVQLLNADDDFVYNNLLNRVGASANTVSQGREQLAAQAGVNAADYTTAEIIRIRDAQRKGDLQAVSFYINHENRNTVNLPVVRMGRDS
ncbi:hypothetical protein [Paenirhodobacter sp.]|uniref:hypothetical protein n=1 Tax=Paenirhodobacter sp. TaxID=1965326 RepID=UPI003B414F32